MSRQSLNELTISEFLTPHNDLLILETGFSKIVNICYVGKTPKVVLTPFYFIHISALIKFTGIRNQRYFVSRLHNTLDDDWRWYSVHTMNNWSIWIKKLFLMIFNLTTIKWFWSTIFYLFLSIFLTFSGNFIKI